MTGLVFRLTAAGAVLALLCAAGPAPASPAPSSGAAPSPGAAASSGTAPLSSGVIAEAGDATVTLGDVQQLLAHLDPAVRERIAKDRNALVELVRSQLARQELLDAARARKWDQQPDVAYRAAMARDSVIVDTYLAALTQPDPAYPSDADVQAAYNANKARFVVPRQYHLMQIFLAVPQDASKQANDAARTRLRDLKQHLSRSPANFAETARRVSQDKGSAQHGGDVGWVREDQLVPAIRDAVAGLPDGAISDPIRAPDGWHLIKLLGIRPAAVAPLAEVRESLVKLLRQQKASDNARAYLQQMQAKTPAEINEIALSRLLAQ